MAKYWFRITLEDGYSRENWVFANDRQDFWRIMGTVSYTKLNDLQKIEFLRVEV